MSRFKGTGALLMVILVFMCFSAGVRAEDITLRADLQQALTEIGELRAELAAMKTDTNWRYRQELKSALEEVPAAKGGDEGQLLLPAGWSIKPYGYIKLDMIYDDSEGTGYLCQRALSESDDDEDDDQFFITARQTRLGAVITAPSIGDAQVRGVIETDFYGSGNNNTGALRMRRAFGEVKGSDWMLMFGQDWEIISPLLNDTINFDYGAKAGNPGFRYPQVRFDKWWGDAQSGKLILQAALQREDNDASYPSLLGRVGYNKDKMQIGISGHYGEEEYELTAGDDVDYDSWSLNGDLRMPVCEMVMLSAEAFWGENYDTHEGTFDGVNTTTEDEIEVWGGWVELKITPNSQWKFNVGQGIVNPENGDLDDEMVSKNLYSYANAWYSFSKYLKTGLEISYYDTEYKNSDSGDLLRFQHSWMLSF